MGENVSIQMYFFSKKKFFIFVTYMQKDECVTVPRKYNFPGIKRKDQYLCLTK